MSEEGSRVSEPLLFSFSALLSLCFQLLSMSLPCLDIKRRTRSLFHGSDGKVSLSGFDDKYSTQKIAQGQKGVGKRQFGQCMLRKAFFHWRKWFMFVQSSFYLCLPCSFPNEITQTKRRTQNWAAEPLSAILAHSWHKDLVCSQKKSANISWLVCCSIFKENSCYKQVLFVYGICWARW